MLKAFASGKNVKKLAIGVAGVTTGAGIGLTLMLNHDLMAADHGCAPAKYPWFHTGLFNTLDHASVRRGYEVYKQVCAACHSMKYTCYRHLVNVSHSEIEAKIEAADVQITDGPNEEGNMFQRPGKLTDAFPSPYPNDEAAKAANNGALPPDLSLITFARKGGADYIFSLLTGYVDPPAGVEPKEGLNYNPYFNGSWIGMAKALYDDVIEYSDGTPATTSQLAKDVSTFLHWSGEKSHDDRKKALLKVCLLFPPVLMLFYVWKKKVFTVIKTRKVVFNPKNDSSSASGPKH